MKILLHPRGTTGQNDAYTGGESQITVDTERWEIRLHDDETPGGHRILNLAQLLLLFMSKDSEFGDVGFDEGDRGIMTRIGDRQWALREIVAGAGITVTNGLGTDGNFVISVGDGLGGMAGSIPVALTTGTAAALAADLPTGWPESGGAIALLKFHVAPADGAVLSVDGATARALITADGTNDVNRVLGANNYGLIVRYEDEFILVGLSTPTGIGINPVTELDATNVQTAIEELTARLVALEGDGSANDNTVNNYYKFAAGGSASESANVPLADGECVYVRMVGPSGSAVYVVEVNGVVIFNTNNVTDMEYHLIVSRIGTAIYYSSIYRTLTGLNPELGGEPFHYRQWFGTGSLDPTKETAGALFSADKYFCRTALFPVGVVAAEATTVNVSAGHGDATVTYSAPGVKL